MKIHRIFLSGLLAVSCLWFGGDSVAEQQQDAVKTTKKTVVQTKLRHAAKPAKTVRKKPVAKQKLAVAKDGDGGGYRGAGEADGMQKPLDLSVPFTDAGPASPPMGESSAENNGQATNIFASETKKKTRPIQLDGRLLMSQEPEVEKQKSADGAGIVINLKP